jgi:proline iminopeptidase
MQNPKANILIIDGFELQYAIEGNGIPAIVIGSHLYYPKTFSEKLRSHFKLIFVDHRGFAIKYPENVENSAFDLNVLVDNVEKVRQSLNLDKIVVIGHSGHGFIALEYAKKYPNHVSHVIMVATPPDLSQNSAEDANQYWTDAVNPERKAVYANDMEAVAKVYASDISKSNKFIQYMILNKAKTWYDYNFDASYLWTNITWNMQMADYVWGVVFRDIDVTCGLEEFNVPTLLALGRYDFGQAPPDNWNKIRGKFNNLTIKIFEKSGHNPQLEEAALFDSEVLNWINSNTDDTP